jgi:hypothetical protein
VYQLYKNSLEKWIFWAKAGLLYHKRHYGIVKS